VVKIFERLASKQEAVQVEDEREKLAKLAN